MTYLIYNKTYKSPSDLITLLKSKGLLFKNEAEAYHFLDNINYFRFKIYLVPFIDASSKLFQSDSYFEDGISLYRFDCDLRDYIFSAIGRLEIKIRSRLDRTVVSHTNDPFWYLDDKYFEKNKLHNVNKFRSSLSSSFIHSEDKYSKHFKKKYVNNKNHSYKSLPPFWILSELTTLGNILTLYGAISKAEFGVGTRNNKLDALAGIFGSKNLTELNNWLKLVRDVRNRCAHHSRVWNSNYREPARIKTLLATPPAKVNRIYNFFAMLHHISAYIPLGLSVPKDLNAMINKYPVVQAKIHSAGFPVNWRSDPFWG